MRGTRWRDGASRRRSVDGGEGHAYDLVMSVKPISTLVRDSLAELRERADGSDPDVTMFVESLDAATALGILPLKPIITCTGALTQEKFDAITRWLSEGYWQSSPSQLVRTACSLLQLASMRSLQNE